MPLFRRQRRSPRAATVPADVAVDSHVQGRDPGTNPRAGDVAVDRVAAGLATAQHGVLARDQLLARGVSEHAIDHRVRTGRLVPLFRGVYAIGHAALPDAGRIRAALLAAGPDAVASHRTAAALLNLLPAMPPFVEVTVPGSPRRARPGLVIHRTRIAPPVIELDGLRVTTPLWTLADLPRAERRQACAEALVRSLVTERELEAARLLPPQEAAPTRSELERRFLRIVRRAGLPRPRVNETIGPYEIDFAWPRQRVLVEVDGFRAHGHRFAFERDRARDAELVALGYVVLRFTWRQVVHEPLTVAARIAQALALRGDGNVTHRGSAVRS